jgi:hypothetical protein
MRVQPRLATLGRFSWVTTFTQNRAYSIQRLIASPSAEAGCLPACLAACPDLTHSFGNHEILQSLRFPPRRLLGAEAAVPWSYRFACNSFLVPSLLFPLRFAVGSPFFLLLLVLSVENRRTLRPPPSTLQLALRCRVTTVQRRTGIRKKNIERRRRSWRRFGLAPLTSSDNPTQ